MSDFTIEQLEALKEGTTPGPWEWSDHRVPDLTGDGLWPIVIEADHDGGRMGDCTLELHIKDEDKRLIAATPALVDALIAEKRAHQKLRAEIEAVLDVVKCETWLHDDEGQFPETVQLGSYVTDQLTRILEATDG